MTALERFAQAVLDGRVTIEHRWHSPTRETFRIVVAPRRPRIENTDDDGSEQ